ncbi:hypothetical protein [Nocardia iowensis]|uniref:Integral membrane plasmid transfer protein n=1 Tax=Nocardia iowensis TaxID=204891 RepID=A0ABX8RQB0_NOCIO|nr:hypothetical protein [Nocardia iowensis]QXN91824.1 hypothetical protein KV110_01095 [Nocardia iowensis]
MTEQGQTYAAFIETELKTERERRATFDARGQALVTTSGALFTLLAGVAALVKTPATTRLPSAVLPMGTVTLLLFVGAAICGAIAGWNRWYAVAAADTLAVMVSADHWIDDEVDARNYLSTLAVETLRTLRTSTDLKAKWVGIGLVIQVLALVALGVTVFITVLHG